MPLHQTQGTAMKTFAAALLTLLLLCTPALAAKPKVGDTLPDLEVKAAPSASEAAYLGLAPGAKSFRLSQIKAPVLLVEIFSMYCPRCQAGARGVNRVFEALNALPQGQKLKFLGLGAGNSAFEVDVFRKQYQIPLPLFQDADYALHKAFGSVGTPSYFVLKPVPGGKGFQVLFFQEGVFTDEQDFLDLVLRASGVQ
ncbi:MAG: TlpA family protein disulfide reductase [Desulfovibrio sp.]|nr:TlpA family protein disulfide reductase [Desulfovibrio sp.]